MKPHSPYPSCPVLSTGSFNFGVKLDVLVGTGIQVERLRVETCIAFDQRCRLVHLNTHTHTHTHTRTRTHTHIYTHT